MTRRPATRVAPRRTSPPAYATVVHEHGHPTALLCAARTGAVIVRTRLRAMAPAWDAARAEAQALYPDRIVVIPCLGEDVPS